MKKPNALHRHDFNFFVPIATRWSDNDIYGHVNNVAYYSFFDTAVNLYLIEHAGLDIHEGQIIGLVVDSGCSYFAPLAYPEQLDAGVRVLHLGNSSVKYQIALFKKDQPNASAQGHFVHVYVDRTQRQAQLLPEHMRSALKAIQMTTQN